MCINDLGIYTNIRIWNFFSFSKKNLKKKIGTFGSDELLCPVVPRDGGKRKSQTFKRKRKGKQKKNEK